MGVLQPVSGTVRIDGAEMTKSTQYQYSAYFGYLPQEVHLFDGTVAENIARFNEADPGRVIEAAQLAGAHELILTLPEAYETKVGPSGINLSGGQKQRIGLARAVYGFPSLVILDEPTSNLDNEGRLAFMATVKRLKKEGITLVVIAHQPSLFESVDKLALVVDGQLQQFGPFKEVIEALSTKTKASSKDKKPAEDTSSTQKTTVKESHPVTKIKPVTTVEPKAKRTITLNSTSASIKQIKKL